MDLEDQFAQAYQFVTTKKSYYEVNFGKIQKSVQDMEYQSNKVKLEEEITWRDQLPQFKPIKKLQRDDIVIECVNEPSLLETTIQNIQETYKQIYNEKKEKLGNQDDELELGRLVMYKTKNNLFFDQPEGIRKIQFQNLTDKSYFLYPGKFLYCKLDDDNNICKLVDIDETKLEEDEQINDVNYNRQDAISIVAAAGPFTFQDSMTYLPLKDLLNKESCDLLILLGPILDESNNLIIDTNQEYEDLYSNIVNYLSEDNENTQIIIFNALNDITSYHLLPQPAPKNTQYSNIHYAGNPAKIILKDALQIAVVNLDILFEMVPIVEQLGYTNKIEQILKEILLQKSYVPCISKNVNQFKQNHMFLQILIQIHILIQ